jgi:hypothetical protein
MSSATLQINVFHFDYNGLPAVKAAALRAEASRIRKLLKATVPTIIEVGRSLIEVKAQLDHGKFGDWVDAECGFSLSSAENYMRVAERFGDKIGTVANLSPTTVYRLAAKSTPPEVVEAALQRAAKGAVISDDNLDMALKAARVAKRQEKKKKLRKLAAKRGAETKKYRAENPDWRNDWRRAEEELANEDGEDGGIEPSSPAEKMNAFLFHSDTAMGLAKDFLATYDGPMNEKVLEAARATAAAWCRLAETMETNAKSSKPKVVAV